MKRVVVNSPGIFTDRKHLVVIYDEIDRDEFCDELRRGSFESAVGHPGAADFIAKACGVDVPVNRRAIDIADYDEVLGIKLNFRPEPGKEYTAEDMDRLIAEGKIKFFKMRPE